MEPVRLKMHPSSVLFRCRPTCVVFSMCQQSASGTRKGGAGAGWFEMQAVTAVDMAWLLELAPHVYATGGGGGGPR